MIEAAITRESYEVFDEGTNSRPVLLGKVSAFRIVRQLEKRAAEMPFPIGRADIVSPRTFVSFQPITKCYSSVENEHL